MVYWSTEKALKLPHNFKIYKIKGNYTHAMKAYGGNGHTSPLILNLSTRWRWRSNDIGLGAHCKN